MKKFKIDNRFFSAMDKIGDLVILNFLWLVCSAPVITIGASTTAMCAVAMQMAAGDDPVIGRAFFKAFKENFRQSTWTFLLLLLAGTFLLIDFLSAPTFQNIFGSILMVSSVAFGIVWLWALIYAFPVQLAFRAGIKETLKRSLILSIQNLPYTIVLCVLFLLPIILALGIPELAVYLMPFFLVIGASCIAFGSAWIFNRIFAKYKDRSSQENTKGNDL